MRVMFALFLAMLFSTGCVSEMMAPAPNLGTKAEKIVMNKSTKADVVQILGQPNSKSSNRYGDNWSYHSDNYSDVVNVNFNKKGVVDDISIRSSSKGSNSFVSDITKDATNTLKNETSNTIRSAIRGVFN